VRRIGIFGGSFDPPHIGHLIIAELAQEQLSLDEVLFVPAFVPPHKAGSHASTALDRLTMIRLAVRGNPLFHVSDIEIRRKGISYTVDTVAALRRRYRGGGLFLIIGGDSLKQFWSWRSPLTILANASLAVYARPGHERPAKGHAGVRVHCLAGPLLQISSTDIRKRMAAGKSVRYFVPEAVRSYIRLHRLYRHRS
jgi:nicotinate-nucleotide adenylyltransferase